MTSARRRRRSASNFINVTYLLHGNPNYLRHLLRYPITTVTVPLSLAHIDGTPLKTDKATLTKALESRRDVVFVDTNLPSIKATISDGGILFYERVMQHSNSTYAAMARDLLVKVCSHCGELMHLLLYKYKSPSIKDVDRILVASVFRMHSP